MADHGPLDAYGQEPASTARTDEGAVPLQAQFAPERWDGHHVNTEDALDSFVSETDSLASETEARPAAIEPLLRAEAASASSSAPTAAQPPVAGTDHVRDTRLDARRVPDLTDGARSALSEWTGVRPAGDGWRWMLAQPAVLVVGVMTVAALGAGIYAAAATRYAATAARRAPERSSEPSPIPVVESGSATITSNPAGASVSIDGVVHGNTPIRVELPLGQHVLELQLGSSTRSIPLTVEPGVTVAQFADLTPAVPSQTPPPTAPAAVPQVKPGRLEITSDPAGVSVQVDGTPRGNTPLVLTDLADGDHRVVVGSGDEAITRRVRVAAGATASVMVSIREPAASAGWVSIAAPFELQIFEAGRLIGTTAAERLMLPVGAHQLELVNESIGFRTTLAANVVADETATVPVPVPDGRLSVNALPWAEVFLDGRSLGTTPLANLSVPIGRHEVVWRHPQLGERKQTITVTMRGPERVGVDLREIQ
jgi:hypothetical protein